jgi:ArsR family transcriptional regulator
MEPKAILARRKEGLQVFYRISDPTIPKLCRLVCGNLGKTLTRQAAHLARRVERQIS